MTPVRSLIIRWQKARLPQRIGVMGHGFAVCAGSRNDGNGPLAAFVDGYEWLRGANEAVVLFDPRCVPKDESHFAAFKAAVEARIRAGAREPSEIFPGFSGWANA